MVCGVSIYTYVTESPCQMMPSKNQLRQRYPQIGQIGGKSSTISHAGNYMEFDLGYMVYVASQYSFSDPLGLLGCRFSPIWRQLVPKGRVGMTNSRWGRGNICGRWNKEKILGLFTGRHFSALDIMERKKKSDRNFWTAWCRYCRAGADTKEGRHGL